MIVVVCTVIVERDKKFLFVQEQKDEAAGKYGLPGGRLEQGETLLACAQREFYEETGFTAGNPKLVAITHKPATQHGNSVVRFVYRAELSGVKKAPGELKTTWLSDKEVRGLVASGHIRGSDIPELLTARGKDLTVSTY